MFDTDTNTDTDTALKRDKLRAMVKASFWAIFWTVLALLVTMFAVSHVAVALAAGRHVPALACFGIIVGFWLSLKGASSLTDAFKLHFPNLKQPTLDWIYLVWLLLLFLGPVADSIAG